MKKILTVLIVLFICNTAKAQFEQGQSFIGGTFFNYLRNYKNLGQDATTITYSHNMEVSLGKFVKTNKAVGWTVTHNLATQKLVNFDINPKPVNNLGIGAQRFWEFYKPMNEKFALYARPAIGISYNLLNEYRQGGDRITMETRTNKLTLGVSIGAGVAWRITPKWALMGGVAFSNPLNVSASFSKEENFTIKDSQGQNRKSKNGSVEYQFVPGVSAGGISLGFRYLF